MRAANLHALPGACDSIHPGIFDGEAPPTCDCMSSRPAKRISTDAGDVGVDVDVDVDGGKQRW